MTQTQQDDKGITILVDLLNGGEFNVLIDPNEPNEDACKSFALFLSMLERGTMYGMVLDKVRELLGRKDKNTINILETVFDQKKLIDANLDMPAILPRDVFKRGG